jgi:GTPase
MFIDEHELAVFGGRGGDGKVSFRREAHVPKGGPDGGDGGDGGSVIFEASEHTHGLAHLQHIRELKADAGQPGQAGKRAGRNAEDKIVPLPVGTIVYELKGTTRPKAEAEAEAELDLANAPEEAFSAEGASGEDDEASDEDIEVIRIADLDKPGMRFVVARGGNGGFGNVHFASATNQSPREANPGRPGQERRLRLEVKLIADVGLVGLPNAGKSTLLARCSRARPKVAAYPFTTLAPHLGLVALEAEARFIMADIPGIIEGAAGGKGLGTQFLRHIERTRVLVHLIDGTTGDAEALKDDHDVILNELTEFSPELAAKPRLVVVNKADVPGVADKAVELSRLLGVEVRSLSGVSGQGVRELLWDLYRTVGQSTE